MQLILEHERFTRLVEVVKYCQAVLGVHRRREDSVTELSGHDTIGSGIARVTRGADYPYKLVANERIEAGAYLEHR